MTLIAILAGVATGAACLTPVTALLADVVNIHKSIVAG